MSTRGDPRPEKRKIDLFCGESNPDIIPEIRYKGPPLVAPASAAAENLSLHKCDHGTPGPGSHSIVSACVVPTLCESSRYSRASGVINHCERPGRKRARREQRERERKKKREEGRVRHTE